MYFIATLNDCKASSSYKNMCGMKTKKMCEKEFLLFLVIPCMDSKIRRIRVGHIKSVGIMCNVDQHVGYGTRLY